MEGGPPVKSDAKYQYRALQHRTEIRCITLSAGTAKDPLTCDINHHKLSDKPSFEAISYVWGSLVRDQTITCNGRLLYITPNLRNSLRQVRLDTTPRVLWVDSICINQDNDKEKGHQVSLMAQIYSQAERVLVTLGADEISSAHSQLTATLVRQISQLVESTLQRISRDWDSYPYDQAGHKILSDPRWKSFDYLICHSWFKRGWVVQEAGLGQDVEIIWGFNTFSWIEIMRTYVWLSARATSSRSHIQRRIPRLHLDIYERQHLLETRTFHSEHTQKMGDNVLYLLCNARRLELTDKRDRIYAFIGLPGFQKLSRDLVVDYDKSWAEVYCDVAHWHVMSTKSLLILNYVEHDRETLASDHPSWVPQWHIRLYAEILRSEDHEKGTNSQTPLPIPLNITISGTLQARGYIMDTIKFTSGTFSSQPSTEEIAAVWDQSRKRIECNAYKHFSPLLAFVGALVADKTSPDTAEGTMALNLASFLRDLFGKESVKQEQRFAGYVDVLENGDSQKVQFVVSRNLVNRNFVVTKRGLFGLAPGVAAEGDLYSVLVGADTPFVLRATGHKGYYKLVGEGSLVSSQDTDQHHPLPYRIGGGINARDDWVGWDLKEEDIALC